MKMEEKMEENIVEVEGKIIDLRNLSDEELIILHKEVKREEGRLKKLMKQWIEKYPFLKGV